MSLVDTLLKLISIESETGKEEKILDFINQFLIENNFNGSDSIKVPECLEQYFESNQIKVN